jgi:hypothetical protein
MGLGLPLPGFSGNQIPNRQIGLQIQLAQNTQTNQPSTFAGLGSSGGGLGSLFTGGGLGSLLSGGIGGNTLNIQGLRASAHIRDVGSGISSCDVKVWGLPPNLMNQLNSLGLALNIINTNNLIITAGDPNSGMSQVYNGTILYCYGDYSNQPETPLVIVGNPSGVVLNATPTSYQSTFAVSDAMSKLAQKMGLNFNNSGNVNTQLPAMYVSGSPLVQIQKLARAAAISFGINPNGTLEIFQKGQPRQGAQTTTISAANGMIASPSFIPNGITVKTLFNPAIKLFDNISVQSSVMQAVASAQPSSNISQTWMVNKIDLDLETQVPKGQWMMTIQAISAGSSPKIPAAT